MAYGTSTLTAAVSLTGDNNVDALLHRRRWASTAVTYSFTRNFSNDYEEEPPLGYPDSSSHNASFQSLNAAQRTAANWWAGAYSSVSGLNLNRLTGSNDRNATIRMAESAPSATMTQTAYARQPGSSFAAGDIWFNTTDYNTPEIGNYAWHTFGHEMGHALGLKHGHKAAWDNSLTLNSARDSMEFSIMTYRYGRVAIAAPELATGRLLPTAPAGGTPGGRTASKSCKSWIQKPQRFYCPLCSWSKKQLVPRVTDSSSQSIWLLCPIIRKLKFR
jgi:rubredoxin